MSRRPVLVRITDGDLAAVSIANTTLRSRAPRSRLARDVACIIAGMILMLACCEVGAAISAWRGL